MQDKYCKSTDAPVQLLRFVLPHQNPFQAGCYPKVVYGSYLLLFQREIQARLSFSHVGI